MFVTRAAYNAVVRQAEHAMARERIAEERAAQRVAACEARADALIRDALAAFAQPAAAPTVLAATKPDRPAPVPVLDERVADVCRRYAAGNPALHASLLRTARTMLADPDATVEQVVERIKRGDPREVTA
jgi:hypothetical protein